MFHGRSTNGGAQMPSSTLSSAALVLVLFTGIGTANSPDDVRPTPEERLAEAGIEVSIPSLTTMLQYPSAAPSFATSAPLRSVARSASWFLNAAFGVDGCNRRRASWSRRGLRHLAAPASVAPLRKVALEDHQPTCDSRRSQRCSRSAVTWPRARWLRWRRRVPTRSHSESTRCWPSAVLRDLRIVTP